MIYDIPEYPTLSRGALLCTFDGGYGNGRWSMDWGRKLIMSSTTPSFSPIALGTSIRALGVSPRGDLLAFFVSNTTSSGNLRVETLKGELLINKAMPAGYVSAGFEQVEFHPNGRWVAVSGNGFVEITDIVTGEQIWQTATGAYSMAFSPDGAYFAYGTQIVTIVRTDTWAQVSSRSLVVGQNISGLEWSQDSTKLFCSCLTSASSTSYWNLQLYDVTANAWRGHGSDTSFYSFNAVSQNAQNIVGLIPSHDRTGVWVIRGGTGTANLVRFDGVREKTATLPYNPVAIPTHWAREVGGFAVANGGAVVGHIPLGGSSGSGFFYLVQATPAGLDLVYYGGSYGGSSNTARRGQVVFAKTLGEISNRDTTPVTDSNGDPLSGVFVRAMSRSDYSLLSSDTTDAEGRFILPVPNDTPCMVLMKAPSDNYNSQLFDWVVAK